MATPHNREIDELGLQKVTVLNEVNVKRQRSAVTPLVTDGTKLLQSAFSRRVPNRSLPKAGRRTQTKLAGQAPAGIPSPSCELLLVTWAP